MAENRFLLRKRKMNIYQVKTVKVSAEAKPQVVLKSICKSLPVAETDLGWSWVNKNLV